MKTIITSFFIFISFVVCGQVNLVPNPSFEILDSCPYSVGQIRFARPWFQPNNPQNIWSSSTDLFSACATVSSLSVPSNQVGYQFAKTGNNYSGIGLFGWPNDNGPREYLEVKLDSVLQSNEAYCVHFFASPYGGNLPFCVSTSALGCYLSIDTLQYQSNNYNPILVQPQLINDTTNYFTDTSSWSLCKWIYYAQGAETFITVGNFWGPTYNLPNSIISCTNGGGGQYIFIDDFSIVKLPKLEAGRDTAITVSDAATLNGSISEVWAGMQFEWQPHTGLDNPYSLTPTANPTVTTTYTLTVSCATCNVPCLTDLRDTARINVNEVPPPPAPVFNIPTLIGEQPFYITGLQPGTRLTIYNLLGQLLFETADYQNNLWPVVVWDEGIYMYELVQADGTRITGKWCLVK
jgi:hypothetical protein